MTLISGDEGEEGLVVDIFHNRIFLRLIFLTDVGDYYNKKIVFVFYMHKTHLNIFHTTVKEEKSLYISCVILECLARASSFTTAAEEVQGNPWECPSN